MNNKLLLLLAIGVFFTGIVQANNEYGGFPSTADKPPTGAVIDEKLTAYYGVPTAVTEDETYWFIGGWGWFNETEMLKLPSDSLMYNISPYDCSVYGCGGSSSIPVPVSGIVIVGFVAVAYLVWRKKCSPT